VTPNPAGREDAAAPAELPIKQQGKPHPPRHTAVSRPRGRGTAEGVEESRRKRTPPCNGADRAARAEIPGPKGRRLPAGLDGAMELDTCIIGDVGRCEPN